ncbi:hypothetical protein K438DRAFT_924306 [Mycena galopus ATCC 62051]|nr:hypothetical protein K438DRAFT_924306 [Mycena galopus ATCC 62051]
MPTSADLSWLFTECRDLGDDGELNETEFLACLLKDCKIQTEELTRRRRKINLAMKNAKTFLDCCDTFLVSLSNMNIVVGPVYGAVKFIVTIAAAKSEILEGIIGCFI